MVVRSRLFPLRAALIAVFLCGAFAVPSRSQSLEQELPAQEPPTLIVISMDGVRADYLERQPLPAFERMSQEGARAESLLPVFPAVTFPNHVSLATGASVEKHGILANEFSDRRRGDYRRSADANWIEAEPLWVAAERQGLRSAVFFWVGSETPWHGVGASLSEAPFDAGVGEEEKVQRMLGWLALPAAERPRLVMSWWHGADGPGHWNGPDSERTREQLAEQDLFLGVLLRALDARNAWEHTTLIVVSDHGMVPVREKRDPWSALEDAGVRARIFSTGGVANVYLDDPTQAPQALVALRKLEGVRAFARSELPEDLRYRHAHRTGDVILLTDPPRTFIEAWSLRDFAFRAQRWMGIEPGSHGFDPRDRPALHGIFLAMGRGIPAGTRLGRVRVLDVAPTAARLLGIEPPQHAEGRAIEGLGAEPADAPTEE